MALAEGVAKENDSHFILELLEIVLCNSFANKSQRRLWTGYSIQVILSCIDTKCLLNSMENRKRCIVSLVWENIKMNIQAQQLFLRRPPKEATFHLFYTRTPVAWHCIAGSTLITYHEFNDSHPIAEHIRAHKWNDKLNIFASSPLCAHSMANRLNAK